MITENIFKGLSVEKKRIECDPESYQVTRTDKQREKRMSKEYGGAVQEREKMVKNEIRGFFYPMCLTWVH